MVSRQKLIEAMENICLALRYLTGVKYAAITPGIIDLQEYLLNLMLWISRYERLRKFMLIGIRLGEPLKDLMNILRLASGGIEYNIVTILPRILDNTIYYDEINEIKPYEQYTIALIPDELGLVDYNVMSVLRRCGFKTLITVPRFLPCITDLVDEKTLLIILSKDHGAVVTVPQGLDYKRLPGYFYDTVKGFFITHKHTFVRGFYARILLTTYDYMLPITLSKIIKVEALEKQYMLLLQRTLSEYISLINKAYIPSNGIYFGRIALKAPVSNASKQIFRGVHVLDVE